MRAGTSAAREFWLPDVMFMRRFVLSCIGIASFATGSANAAPSLDTLETRAEAIGKLTYPASEKADIRLILKVEPRKIKRLTTQLLAYARAHPDADGVFASGYLMALTRMEFGDSVAHVPVPAALASNPELSAAYTAQLASYSEPIYALGRETLTKILDKSASLGTTNQWVTKAQALLDAHPAQPAAASEATSQAPPTDPVVEPASSAPPQ